MTQLTAPALACDDLGAGEPALLCLPGWCGDRTVFDPLLPLVAQHRRVLGADLPGHGDSPVPGWDVTGDDVVTAVVELVEGSGVQRVVPLALSHAGWFAIELRRRLGADRVPGVVLLDWMVLGPVPGFLGALAGLQDDGAWHEVREALFGRWTAGVEEPRVHDYVAGMGRYGAAHWHRAGREIAAAFADQDSPVAALERLPVPCPTLHLYAQPADEAYLTAQRAYAHDHPWFAVHRLAAGSHFPTFEVPQEMAEVLEEFLCALT